MVSSGIRQCRPANRHTNATVAESERFRSGIVPSSRQHSPNIRKNRKALHIMHSCVVNPPGTPNNAAKLHPQSVTIFLAQTKIIIPIQAEKKSSLRFCLICAAATANHPVIESDSNPDVARKQLSS